MRFIFVSLLKFNYFIFILNFYHTLSHDQRSLTNNYIDHIR